MTILEPGFYYHIYNHANGDEDIFKEVRNYIFFLEKYRKYIYPVAETFSCCLMKNHFHLLVRIREADEIGYYKKLNTGRSNDSARFVTTQDLSDCKATDRVGNEPKCPDPTRHLSHLFNTYIKYYNKTYQRKGGLFISPFKRKQITTDLQFRNALIYIHMNPIKHGFCANPGDWRYSSFNAYLKRDKQTLLLLNKSIEWFGDFDNLIKCHKISQMDCYENEGWE